MKIRTGNRTQEGYTLMELLVVLLILGLIAGIAAPQVMNYLSRAKGSTAKLQLEGIVAALDFYKIDVGSYPTEEQGLDALLVKPDDAKNWMGPYVNKRSNIVDPWGEVYQFKAPGEHGEIDIFSYGADIKQGGEGEDADILSWEEE